ncbi:Folylpolyglutamate synthetase [Elasticomyces elasticus]|nr:Folylpolyglutamate synthetase [Elasticomyces elasticus]KAK3648657.1 Folylpolyglutamate synthetase [Elasticomyces elasticus]KAK4932460.1 Folylpolyglutamate synthetase [Elasticomyces elasticus]KAK5760161.1 Folylpolyglutamate synthetase [Elasticomyces elasticus]
MNGDVLAKARNFVKDLGSKPYVYEKLDSERKQIRLLEILPDKPKKPLRAIIKIADLESKYETISYAWGIAKRSARIVITGADPHDKRYLRVPRNTEAALKRVRLLERPRIVWIDAVCINQDNNVERSQQVAIMGMIYSSSLGNLVYLGELEDADMAVRVQRTIDNLLTHARSQTNDLRKFYSIVVNPVQQPQMERQGLPFEVDLDAVCVLLTLPWFRRLWVLQEAVMAPNSTAFLGSLQLDLHDMLRAIVWWDGHITSYPSGTTQGVRCLMSTYFALDRRGDSRAPSAQSSNNLLITAQAFQKSEPRDSIFSLRAMMDERSSSALSPDYTRPLSQVLESASRLAIEESLAILRYIAHRPGDLERAEVASWAVRVDREIDYEIDPFAFPWREGRTYMVSEWRDDSPGGGWESKLLNLKGHHAETVRRVTPFCTLSIHEDREALLMWLWQAKELFSSISLFNAHEVSSSALGRILCADDRGGRRYHELDDEEKNPIERFLAALSPATNEDTLKLLKASETSTPSFWKFILYRRCFVTQQGRLGLGPRDMQSGDVVAMLSGAGYPCILRPLDDGQYQLVGAAYVDGVMPEDLGVEWEAKEGQVFALV